MKTTALFTAISLMTVASVPMAYAHQDSFENNHCNINLNHDVTITPDHILIRRDSKTLYDIYQDDQVFYKGEALSLSSDQAQLINEYAAATRALVPEINTIVIDAIDIASNAINTAFTELGVESDIESKFDNLQDTLISKYNLKDGTYHFSASNVDVDYANREIDMAMEEMMEEIVPSLVGNVLQLLGKAITQGEAGFANLENLDERIDAQIEAQSDILDARVERLCNSIERLDLIEKKISRSSNTFEEFDTIVVDAK